MILVAIAKVSWIFAAIPFLPSLVCHGSGAWIDDLLDTKELLS